MWEAYQHKSNIKDVNMGALRLHASQLRVPALR